MRAFLRLTVRLVVIVILLVVGLLVLEATPLWQPLGEMIGPKCAFTHDGEDARVIFKVQGWNSAQFCNTMEQVGERRTNPDGITWPQVCQVDLNGDSLTDGDRLTAYSYQRGFREPAGLNIPTGPFCDVMRKVIDGTLTP